LLAVQISAYWYPTPDASAYLSIARSIAAGRGPANLGSRQLYLAPGYPVLISPLFRLGSEPFIWVSGLHWALAVAFMLGVYRWARGRFPDGALLITALAVVNVELWTLYRRTLSEAAFLALLIWTVNALEAAAGAVSLRRRLGLTGLASVLTLWLATTRQAGITVAAGFGTLMLLDAWHARVSWRRALGATLAVGAPATLALLGLAFYDRAMAAGSPSPTYLDHLTDPNSSWAGQVAEGFRLRITEVGRLTVPGMFKSYGRRGAWVNVNMAVYVPLFLAVVGAVIRLGLRCRDVLALTFPFYLALYLVWPFDQATRFTLPMLPLLMAALWMLSAPLGRGRPRLLGAALVLHLGVALAYWTAVDLPRARDDNAQWPSLRRLAAVARTDGKTVMASGVAPNAIWMFQYLVDRRVREELPDTPVGDDVRWLIVPEGDPGRGGFACCARSGGFQLLVRGDRPGEPAERGLAGIMSRP
jgi:hypothetical protein